MDIPTVVRRPFADAGGKTLVELAGEDPAVALAHVRAGRELAWFPATERSRARRDGVEPFEHWFWG